MAEKTDEAPGAGQAIAHAIAERADKIKYLLIAVVVILVAAIAIFHYVRRSNLAQANAAKNQVFQSLIDVSGKPAAEAVPVFAKAAKDHSGTAGGAQANILEYSFAYDAGDYPAAEKAIREFIKTYPQSAMIPRARLALGQVLAQQGKNGEAIEAFRRLLATNDVETMPEAKLALAQTLEKDAESVRDNPDEYARRLEEARAEYLDIISRSRNTSLVQRGWWPQAVMLLADYNSTLIKDRLNGYEHGVPEVAPPAAAPVTPEEFEGAAAVTPPSEAPAEPAAAADAEEDAAPQVPEESGEAVETTPPSDAPATAGDATE